MVDISSGDKKINITVSTSGNKASVNATPDTAMYYSNKSREWAISDKIVDNEDYSSKYYANESKKQAETVKDKITEVNSAVAEGITNIINQENISVDNVNTAGATQVNLATEQATIATEQAAIATAKTSEVVESGNAALNNISNAKTEALGAITAQETTSKNNIETKGAEQIELIQNEGAIQIANVQSTGFYMRDDKLYYINSLGEETEFKSGGSGLEVCDIGMALYVDETKGLRRYLNGQIVDINANTQAFLDRLKEITTLYPSLLCTEGEWQTAKTMSAFGQVGKFVINEETGYIRLPRVVNIQGVFDLQNLGLTVDAGLPNITGSFTESFMTGNSTLTGAFYGANDYVYDLGSSGGNQEKHLDISFNASRSNNIYGNSNTVQQEAVQFPYFIQIANGTQEQVNIVNNIELNNPYTLFDIKYSEAPLFNVSWLLSNGQWNTKVVYIKAYEALLVEANPEISTGNTVTLPSGTTYTKRGLKVVNSTDIYTDYDFVLDTTNESFRLPIKSSLEIPQERILVAKYENGSDWWNLYSDGWLEQGGEVSDNTFVNLLKPYANANYGISLATKSLSSGNGLPNSTFFNKNFSGFSIRCDYVTQDRNDGASWRTCGYGEIPSIQDYDKNTKIYFYVGETIQNANLINAAGLSEIVAEKTDMLQASAASLPSGVHVNLTLGASGTSYIAPADGYFRIQKQPGVAGGNVCLATASCSVSQQAANTNHAIWLFIPVRKNQVMNVWYSATGATDLFEFVHTEGAL